MDNSSEYNDRQLRLMLGVISEYESGEASLGKLVSDLEALEAALEKPNPTFAKDFRQVWGDLETIYALMLDDGRTTPTEDEVGVVRRILKELKPLISS